MSAVELPYVASARSTSSSSSSSSMRRSLHSAGSAASHVSSRSLRNNAYNGSEEEEDDEEEYDEEGEEGYQEGEEPHEASGGLWDEVEHFLNKPPPSFAVFAKEDTKPSGNNVLPTLRRERKPVAPSGNQQSSDGKAYRPAVRVQATNGAVGIKAIDPKLLQEAFAYAEKIQKLNFDDEEVDEQQNEAAASRQRPLLHRDASGSSSSTSSGPRIPADMLKKQGSMPRTKSREGADQAKKKKTKSASAYGVSVKPQKKKSERALNPTKDSSQWDSDMNGDGGNGRKGSAAGSLDPQTVQSLVSNFQNGTTLDELRRELAAAQQSMAMSRQVIQEAAKSFFQTRKS